MRIGSYAAVGAAVPAGILLVRSREDPEPGVEARVARVEPVTNSKIRLGERQAGKKAFFFGFFGLSRFPRCGVGARALVEGACRRCARA